MNKTLTKVVILFFMGTGFALANNNEFDDYNVRNRVDMAAFSIGSDNHAGSLYYIVIRTTNQCFLQNITNFGNSGGGGLSSVTCESIKVIPEIKDYLETGKRP